MKRVEDVKSLLGAGYAYNPYTEWWTKKVGSRRSEILPMRNSVHTKMYDGIKRKNDIIVMTLADAIEDGDKWLEAGDAE
ncbi:MAG: hypothetical protein IKR81_16150 [Victivallales bacterium]|nr:hypothetical protein [Victivallales bacterium]